MNTRAFVVIAALVALGWPVWALAATPDVTEPKNLDSFTLWGLVLGAASSLLTAVLTKSHWRQDVKLVVFGAFSVVAAAGNAYWHADLDAHDWGRSLLIVLAAGWAFYLANKGALAAVSQRTD